MQIFLVLALLIALFAVIFALQNVAVVSISLFVWTIDVSLAIALLAALGAGVLITLLLSVPGKIKSGLNSASSKKRFSNLEAEREALKAKIEEIGSVRDSALLKLQAAENEVSKLEEELASLSAALEAAEKSSGIAETGSLPPADDSPGTSKV